MVKVLISLIIILFTYTYADSKNNKENAPIIIEADSFEYDNKAKLAIYRQNVVVRKEDFTLWADKMYIYFDENSKINQIIADGNVKFRKKEYTGKANKAIYNSKKEIIKLIGSAEIRKGNNILEGDEINYYLKEDKALVIGKNKKVKTIIVPEEIKQKGGKK